MLQPKERNILIISTFITFLIPVILYISIFFRIPLITPDNAIILLNENNTSWRMLDIQEDGEYFSQHISGAFNFPFSKIKDINRIEDLPETLRNGNLVIICTNGFRSAFAVRKFMKLSVKNVLHIEGGISGWVGLDCNDKYKKFCEQSVNSVISKFNYKNISLFEQWAVTLSAFLIKPLYMLISFLMIIILKNQKSSIIRIFKAGLVFFFIGEAFCSVNYLFFNENSFLIEYIHMFGMAMSFGLTVLAVITAIDEKIIRFSPAEKKCSLLDTCGNCYKYSDFECSIKKIFQYFILILIVISTMPLLVKYIFVNYNSNILGTAYSFNHHKIYQIIEIRYLPSIAILFFILSFIFLKLKTGSMFNYSKIFLSMGLGFVGFSFFRMIFLHIYQTNMTWFICWEEITELFFMLGSAYLLWIFRKSIFNEKYAG